MGNLLTFDFWFSYYFVDLLPIFLKLFIASIIFFVILTIVAFILKRRKNLYAGLWLNIYGFACTNAVIGLILSFFYYEQAVFFSARIWFLFWALEIVLWIISIVKLLIKIPKNKKEIEAQMAYNKYLPK